MNGWKIVAKTSAGDCEHCLRELKFVWHIVHEDGRKMAVGRGCIKTVTGWNVSQAQAESALRYAESLKRRAAGWSAFTSREPQLAEMIDSDIKRFAEKFPNTYGSGFANEVKLDISENRYGYADRWSVGSNSHQIYMETRQRVLG
jgi:hypothetical protein